MKKKLILIDTFNFLHRAYHALPKTFTDKEGNPTNAIYGVTSMLISLFEQVRPDYVIAALDSEAPTFRVEDFTAYKAHRKPLEDSLASQIPKVFEILSAFGIKQIEVSGYEADDIIGTVAHKFASKDLDVIVVSNDRDMWQLINENVYVMLPGRANTFEWLGYEEAEKRLGFKPESLIDYKALRGDPSDNIPGVYGVGEVTAKRLISEFGGIEEIYKNIAKVVPESLREKLANNAEEAVMSKKLATIALDTPLDFDIAECKYSEFNRLGLKDVLEKYNFKSLIKRLGFDIKSTTDKKEPDANQLGLF